MFTLELTQDELEVVKFALKGDLEVVTNEDEWPEDKRNLENVLEKIEKL